MNEEFNSPEARLERRIEAINTQRKYTKQVIFEVQDYLSRGFKLTKNFSLYKKDKEALETILNDNLPDNIRAHLDVSEYSIYLKVNVRYISHVDSNEVYGTNYIINEYYIGSSQDFKVTEFPDNLNQVSYHGSVSAQNLVASNKKEIMRLEEMNRKLTNKFELIR